MSRKITTLSSFKIDSKFEKLIKIFESKEADISYSEFDIKLLFRGLSNDDPKKVTYIYDALDENIQKFFQANSEWIKSQIVDFSTI